MQYQSDLSGDELINLAVKRYFGSVDNKDMDGTLACFHDEAILTVQTSLTTHAGKAAIKRMFADFFSSFERIIHRDFECTADPANGRICASFTAELITKDGRTNLLHNTNFWRVRGDRFQEVYVYMSGDNVLI
ncbi:hypothetical protein GCM10007972_26490 [Iodidimonas muriae]|uniref:SnoaL-like domain-containing protein n=1 Tax=Iodidimonas muriae TaxID=261467 RepID=A0ABQ2LGW3_9PROT|nr:nuclear transport factor 2 family protein [Iodidimonas muriae]GER08442.1 hypothetical protein JCM17843_27520 [Kordiimonadales bacterium JCM 17843]GGO16911.1 hypothetical protein GCM10007972_26490 [Iodidimonas muriae]